MINNQAKDKSDSSLDICPILEGFQFLILHFIFDARYLFCCKELEILNNKYGISKQIKTSYPDISA